MKKIFLFILGIAFLFSCEQNNKPVETPDTNTNNETSPKDHITNVSKTAPESEIEKISYSLGFMDGQALAQKDTSTGLILEHYFRGLIDGVVDTSEFFRNKEIRDIVFEHSQVIIREDRRRQAKMQYQQQLSEMQSMPPEMQRTAMANKAQADQFLAENAKRPEIKTTPIGAQYEVIEKGNGMKPDITSSLTMHVRVELLDGTLINDSWQNNEPVTFTMRELVPGWAEVVEQMQTGARVKAYIPPEAGYGLNGSQTIPPNALLIIEMELLKLSARKKG
jgi:FKBP-type peptidyl-prolyl cis-trans isomerase FklB